MICASLHPLVLMTMDSLASVTNSQLGCLAGGKVNEPEVEETLGGFPCAGGRSASPPPGNLSLCGLWIFHI
jgi:hypothetical protein